MPVGNSVLSAIAGLAMAATVAFADERPRARDIGVSVGIFPTGEWNAITDVPGVRVGQVTKIAGEDIRTGVTAIVPGPGNLYRRPVPAAVHVGNGYGKLTGVSQIRELGEIETPILLTCTLCVWRAADALKDWMYAQPGIDQHTINPVVGETNDGHLNNMWANPIGRAEVFAALDAAASGPVDEGSVGAGTGTQAFAWKGGIGTSSRVLPGALGGHRVGVLVQTNFGGMLSMNGAPIGRELGQYAYREQVDDDSAADRSSDGSIMMVVATDAPLTAHSLERLAMRAMLGLARTGSYASNGSGDYVIAFSTHPDVRRPRGGLEPSVAPALSNEAMSPLFAATVEATEEAIYNALLKATSVTSSRGRRDAIPIDDVLRVLDEYNARD